MTDLSLQSHLHTVRDFIRWSASRMTAEGVYFGHGTSNAIDEAAALVLHALHLPPDLHAAYFDANLVPDEKRAILNLLDQRVGQRIPLPYLTQRAWFMGLPFFVDRRVLIPRSPLAELIERQFAPWVQAEKVSRILDLCTGSGCIGIACAHAFPEAEIDLADISTEALDVAAINVADHGVDDRVELIRSDLFSALAGRRYGLILSNPPYVGHDEMTALPPEYAHEPRLALESGEDGLDAPLAILKQAREFLEDDGVLVVEVGNAQWALRERLPELPFLWLEFERGGEGVFLLSAAELDEHADVIAAA